MLRNLAAGETVHVEKESRGCVWRPVRGGAQGTRVSQPVVNESGEPHKPRAGSFKKSWPVVRELQAHPAVSREREGVSVT